MLEPIHKDPSARFKCLKLNLDLTIYGSFAEIGAGQEVARNFFQAGGASGTVAKTISAYDMALSDEIYGKSPDGRYVSKSRLHQMLNYEYNSIISILKDEKPENTKFFAFASTVAAINYKKDNEPHAWIGLKFQAQPSEEPSIVEIHIRLLENDNLLQQNSLGIIGVNLIYASYYLRENSELFLNGLFENLDSSRIEVDMISTSGSAFHHFDNRLLSVLLVRKGMAQVALFNRNGEIQQPSDSLYKKNVLVLRGSFRPITYVGFDMLKSAYAIMKNEENFKKENTISLCEITLDNLLNEGNFEDADFLDRVDILCGMGQSVLISNYREFYKLTTYFTKFKINNIRLIIGANTLLKVLNPVFYTQLKGGILEAFGRLFANNVKIFLYPAISNEQNKIINSRNLPIDERIKKLYEYLWEHNFIIDMPNIRYDWLEISSHEVLNKIKNNDKTWELMVPRYVSKLIKQRILFGFKP